MWNTMLSSSGLVSCCLIFLESGLFRADDGQTFLFVMLISKRLIPLSCYCMFLQWRSHRRGRTTFRRDCFISSCCSSSPLICPSFSWASIRRMKPRRSGYPFDDSLIRKSEKTLWSMKLIQRRFCVYNYPLETYDINFMCEKQYTQGLICNLNE